MRRDRPIEVSRSVACAQSSARNLQGRDLWPNVVHAGGGKRRRASRASAVFPRFLCTAPSLPCASLTHGFEVPLEPERSELRIGRASPPLVDVQLPLASISGLHALLTRDEHSLKVTDQGSKNGMGYAHGWSPGGYVRSTSLLVNTGDRFALGSVGLLALDAQTHQLVQPLAAYCGPGAHDEVDDALETVIRGHMLIACGSRADELHELARMLHDHSVRRDFPFTKVDAIPGSDEAIDELCTRAGCGTIFSRSDQAVPCAASVCTQSVFAALPSMDHRGRADHRPGGHMPWGCAS